MKKLLERIMKRRYAYRRVFLGENGSLTHDGEIILKDLKKFCRAAESTAVVSPVSRQMDPLATAMAEGRREVWLRIMAHLHIDDAILMKLNEEPEEYDNG